MSQDIKVEPTDPTPLKDWQVPGIGDAPPLELLARAGEITTVVGANGVGKSALCLWLYQNRHGSAVKRVVAHRQLWFEHAGPDISSGQREAQVGYMANWDSQVDSRYLMRQSQERTNIVMFDLLASISDQNQKKVDLYDEGKTAVEVNAITGPGLMPRLNTILSSAGLAVQIRVTNTQTLEAVNLKAGTAYPSFSMSDGEKSALLLAAEVLTAPAGSVLLVDEPERHLHRSISAGLVRAILRDRPDCHFVIFTHDLDLAAVLDQHMGSTLVVTGCNWVAEQPSGWEIYVLDGREDIPESARRAILGGRRDMLFVEGDNGSLDTQLYELLLPGWTLQPAGGSDEVIRAVTGLVESREHHWINAHGLVDGDERTDDERNDLGARHISVLDACEVENLYYTEAVLVKVANKVAATLGKNSADMVGAAKDKALDMLREEQTLGRLARKVALARVRREAMASLPTTIRVGTAELCITVPSHYANIFAEFEAMTSSGDFDGLVRRLPIRDTGMRQVVANALEFRHFSLYEEAARVCVREDEILATNLRSYLATVPSPGSEG